MDDLRTHIATELGQLRDDTHYTEKAHFAAATEWGSARTSIGVITTLAGAASTATIIADQLPALAAVFAVVAALAAAALAAARTSTRPPVEELREL